MLLGRGGPKDERGRRLFQFRPVRRLFGLMLVALGCVSGLLALSLVQFFRLTTDAPVARLEVRQQGDGQFQVRASAPGIGEAICTVWRSVADRRPRGALEAACPDGGRAAVVPAGTAVRPLWRRRARSCRHALGPLAGRLAGARPGLVEEELPELVSVRRCAVRQRRPCPCSTGPATRSSWIPGRCSPARTDRPRRKAQAPGLVRLSLPRSPRAGGRPSTFASKINGVASMGTKL